MKLKLLSIITLILSGQALATEWDYRIECFGEKRDVILNVNERERVVQMSYSTPPFDEFSAWSFGEVASDIEKDTYLFKSGFISIFDSYGYAKLELGEININGIKEKIECRRLDL